MKHFIKNALNKLAKLITDPICEEIRRGNQLQAEQTQRLEKLHAIHAHAFELQVLNQDRYKDPKRLARYELSAFSQAGEDGIINEIFRRIGTADRTFLEIAAGYGDENCTRFLLTKGWRGVWVEGSEKRLAVLRANFKPFIDASALRVVSEFITESNVVERVSQQLFAEELDLLSLDIDRNTYHILKPLLALKPRAIVVEYNAVFPPEIDWKVQAGPDKMWDGSTLFGASLKAFETLASDADYNLVGCDLTGVNVYFVRKDLCGDHFVSPYTAEEHFEPPRFFLIPKRGTHHSRDTREDCPDCPQ